MLLVVEVADSSIAYDRDVKAYIFARSGIHEYWLLNPGDGVLVRHLSPEGGTYRTVDEFSAEASIAPSLLPDCVIRLDDVMVR